jgi:hypothetical protein
MEGCHTREQLVMKMLREEVENYLHEDLHFIDEGETSKAQFITILEWWKVHEYQFFFPIKYSSYAHWFPILSHMVLNYFQIQGSQIPSVELASFLTILGTFRQ